eukprot:scaffold49225_cov20-Tisochrysis_lutea.AAC.1
MRQRCTILDCSCMMWAAAAGQQRVAELLSGHPVACLLKDCGQYFKEGGSNSSSTSSAAYAGGGERQH